jgi:hypothetical protein
VHHHRTIRYSSSSSSSYFAQNQRTKERTKKKCHASPPPLPPPLPKLLSLSPLALLQSSRNAASLLLDSAMLQQQHRAQRKGKVGRGVKRSRTKVVVLRKQPDLKLQKRYGMSYVCTLWVQTRACFDSSCHWVGCFFFLFGGCVSLVCVCVLS